MSPSDQPLPAPAPARAESPLLASRALVGTSSSLRFPAEIERHASSDTVSRQVPRLHRAISAWIARRYGSTRCDPCLHSKATTNWRRDTEHSCSDKRKGATSESEELRCRWRMLEGLNAGSD